MKFVSCRLFTACLLLVISTPGFANAEDCLLALLLSGSSVTEASRSIAKAADATTWRFELALPGMGRRAGQVLYGRTHYAFDAIETVVLARVRYRVERGFSIERPDLAKGPLERIRLCPETARTLLCWEGFLTTGTMVAQGPGSSPETGYAFVTQAEASDEAALENLLRPIIGAGLSRRRP